MFFGVVISFVVLFTLHTFIHTTDWATIFFNDHSKSSGGKTGFNY